jgi:choline dehydrogenase-like flavoprotein
VEVRPLDGGPLFNISVENEVIISAGVFGSPAILQRSGIGPAAFLQSANIPLVLDLPGVGSNLHDHSGPRVAWNCKWDLLHFHQRKKQLIIPQDTKPLPFYPLPSEMLNETYAAAAAAAFDATPATGPYTLGMSNSAIWVSLPNVTATYSTITDAIRHLAKNPDPSALHLPAAYNADKTLIAGYRTQLLHLADLLANPHSPSLESAFATGTSAAAVHLHPLSRGTARLNLSDPFAPPILDYRSASNPLDMAVHVAHTRFLRRMVDTATLRGLGAVEVAPGAALQTDAELARWVRANTVQSYMHPCCTVAMMPREKGGVVGRDLTVHGARGLRVVDMSVLPVLPGAHLSATAYAVGEKVSFFVFWVVDVSWINKGVLFVPIWTWELLSVKGEVWCERTILTDCVLCVGRRYHH